MADNPNVTDVEFEQAGSEAHVVSGIARNTDGPSADDTLSGYKCYTVAVLGQGSRIVGCKPHCSDGAGW